MTSQELLALFQDNQQTDLIDYFEEKLKDSQYHDEIKKIVDLAIDFTSVSLNPIINLSSFFSNQLKTVNSHVWAYENRELIKKLPQTIIQTENITLIEHLVKEKVFDLGVFLIAAIEENNLLILFNLLHIANNNSVSKTTFISFFSQEDKYYLPQLETLFKENNFDITLTSDDLDNVLKQIIYHGTYNNIDYVSSQLVSQQENPLKIIEHYLEIATTHNFFHQNFEKQLKFVDFCLNSLNSKDHLNVCQYMLFSIERPELFLNYLNHFKNKDILNVNNIHTLKEQLNSSTANECFDIFIAQLEKNQLENSTDLALIHKSKIKI